MNTEFTDAADLDFDQIWLYNAERYDLDHADKYQEFLLRKVEALAVAPTLGSL